MINSRKQQIHKDRLGQRQNTLGIRQTHKSLLDTTKTLRNTTKHQRIQQSHKYTMVVRQNSRNTANKQTHTIGIRQDTLGI